MFLNAKKYFYLMFILCLILLVLPLFLRYHFNDNYIVGEDSYSVLRTSNYIKQNNAIPNEDPFSYGGRPYIGEYGLPLLLAFNPELLSKIVPIIFGLLSFILFYFILEKIYPEVKGLGTLFWIISPSFIYLFSTITKNGIGIMLTLFGVYLILNKKKYVGLAVFIIVGFFSFLMSIFLLICFCFYSIYKDRINDFYYLFVGNFIVFFVQFHRVFTLGFPSTYFGFVDRGFNTLLSNMLSDFGGIYGFGFFMFVLGIIGVYFFWKEKYKFIIVYFILGVLIYLSLYFGFLIFYINIFLVVLAAYSFNLFLKNEWKSETFKSLSLLLLVCGLMFSTISYFDNVPKFPPNSSFAEGINFLNNQNVETNIFSYYDRGQYLSYGGMKNFIDDNFFYALAAKERWYDSDKVFHSDEIEDTLAILNRYNIEYIWVDTQMIDKLWSGDEIEFLFLLRYSPQNFAKVFDNGDVEIYKYIGDDNV